jgi:hypothetical protein
MGAQLMRPVLARKKMTLRLKIMLQRHQLVLPEVKNQTNPISRMTSQMCGASWRARAPGAAGLLPGWPKKIGPSGWAC